MDGLLYLAALLGFLVLAKDHAGRLIQRDYDREHRQKEAAKEEPKRFVGAR